MITIDKSQLDAFRAKLNVKIEDMKETIIERLQYIGESAVKRAREVGNYEDRTGNLRSSIGYSVLWNGETVAEGGQQQITGSQGNGEDGLGESQTLLNKLKGEFPKGAVLIVCAGMQYAWYVENVHHRDVLVSAELEAERLVKKLFKLD